MFPDSALSYTGLLIPRFPSHQLIGDLAEYLPQWLQQICVSYGWRLEFTTVLPDYFQWVLIVAPSVPPGYFMQAVRSETSKLILSNFGHIKRENLSDDFWAPGYLVVLGARPHPKDKNLAIECQILTGTNEKKEGLSDEAVCPIISSNNPVPVE